MMDAIGWVTRFSRRMLMLLRHGRFDSDLEQEMRLHQELREQEQVERGVLPEEAHYAAQRRFGNKLVLRDESREMWGWNWLETFLQDVRYGLRQLRRNPGFFIFAVVVLALGIGANTAIFTVAYDILLRPLPYRNASRLVMVWEDASAFGFPQDTPSPGNFASWRSQNNVFSDMAAMDRRKFDLAGRGNPEQFLGVEMTANMFPLLGVKPALGRNILSSEDKPGANRVVILSHAVWMGNFGGSSDVIGKEISLNGASYTVVGVMPRGFIFPNRAVQMWTPIGFSGKDLANHGRHYLHVIARLKPGISLTSANADLALIAQNLQKQFPDSNTKVGAYAVPLRERLTGNSRLVAIVLLGAVGFVLLIACANLANLLLVRAVSRQKELAMRIALGAGRSRIIRQMLTESLLLSAIAGCAGLLLAVSATPLLAHFVPNGLAPINGRGINAIVLAFLVATAILCGMLFGLVPALRVSRLDLVTAIKQSGAASGVGASATRMRELLVVAEVALAMILFSGAILMLRSLINIRGLDPGFRPAHVLALETELPSPEYDNVARRNAFFERVLERINHLPGVVAAGCTTWLPLTNWGGAGAIIIEGRPAPEPGHAMIPNLRMISHKYIQAIGMRLIKGRTFDSSDGPNTPRVALINQAAAKAFWSGENPIGTRFKRDNEPPQPWITVVGIVGDVRQAGLDQPPRPAIYFPYQQWSYFRPSYIAVHAVGDPMELANTVRKQIWSVDRDQPVTSVMPLKTMLEDYLAPREMESALFSGFAGFALLLAALGIYAVLAFSIAQRTQEIGVRVALGAQRWDILRGILTGGLKLAVLGIGIGLAGALALTRFLSSLLYGVKPTDPLTLTAASLILICVAVFASYIPARRATRVDPMVALRHE